MTNYRKVFGTLLIGLLMLVGCTAEEELPSFTLQELSGANFTEDIPAIYLVNSKNAPNQITIMKNEMVNEIDFVQTEEKYPLENVELTEDEIVLEYNNQVDRFNRLSETIAEDENNNRYQYTDTSMY